VRQAEGRAHMVQLAEQLGKPELVTPQRTLVMQLDVEAQKLPSSTHDSLGVRHENRIWLCSDVILLGKPGRSYASAAYELVQQGPLSGAELDSVALSSSGASALRLCTRSIDQSRCVAMLWVREPEVAATLLRCFQQASDVDRKARERTEQAKQDRAKIALASIEERRAGDTNRRREALRRRRVSSDGDDVAKAAALSLSPPDDPTEDSTDTDLTDLEVSKTPRRRERGNSSSESKISLSLSWSRTFSWTARLRPSRPRAPSGSEASGASSELGEDQPLGGIAAGPSLAKPRKLSGAADSVSLPDSIQSPAGLNGGVASDRSLAAPPVLPPPQSLSPPASPRPPPIPPSAWKLPQPDSHTPPSANASPLLKRLHEAPPQISEAPAGRCVSPRSSVHSPRSSLSSASEPFDTTVVDQHIDSIKRRLVAAGLQI